MKNIVVVVLTVLIFTSCTKSDNKKGNIIDNTGNKDNVSSINNKTVNDNLSVIDNKSAADTKLVIETTQVADTVEQSDKVQNVEKKAVPLNKIDLDALSSNYYNTNALSDIKKVYDNDLYKALSTALQYGYLDIADALVKNVEADDYLKSVIIDNLVLGNDINKLQTFLDKHNIKLTDNNSAIPQAYIYSNNRFLSYKMAEYLLANGADPNAVMQIDMVHSGEDWKMSIALFSVWNQASFDLLYKYNVDLNAVELITDNFFCGTFVLKQLLDGNMENVKSLLKLGANPYLPSYEVEYKYIQNDYCNNYDFLSLYTYLEQDENYFNRLDEYDKQLYRNMVKTYSKRFLSQNEDSLIPSSSERYKKFLNIFSPEDVKNKISNRVISIQEEIIDNKTGDVRYEISKEYVKVPYITELLSNHYKILQEGSVNEYDFSHVSYIYQVINSGVDMESPDNLGKTGLDYLVAGVELMPYSDLIDYASAYIYRDGHDKKTAVNNLMAAVKRAGLQQDDNYFTKYIYKMYDRFNQ